MDAHPRAPALGRRGFLGAAATLLVTPIAPRRVYSFLWDNPLVVVPGENVLAQLGGAKLLRVRDRVYKPFFDALVASAGALEAAYAESLSGFGAARDR